MNFTSSRPRRQAHTCPAYYCLLLSYKIECRVLPGNEDDAVFSLNVMADSPDDPSTFEVEIDNAKFDYLQSGTCQHH